MSRTFLGRLLLALGILGGLLLACTRTEPRFAHREHLGMQCGKPGQPACLTCITCHGELLRKDNASRHFAGQPCNDCHRPGDIKVAKSLHAPATPAAQMAAQIQFDHARHLQMDSIQGQCIACHAGLVSEESGPPFPEMSRCFECHNHQAQWDQGVCVPCHRTQDLKKLFPRTYLRHGLGWDKAHGPAASESVAQCANCHTAESCDDCHDVTQGLKVEVRTADQIQKNFVHPADFLTRHAMEAASQPARCLSCHRTETCESCHLARGVSAARLGAINPHPPGWTGPDSSQPNHHGRAARRDILACASCHDQGPNTNCIDCHRVGGPGGNPHPSGWKSTRTLNDAMCSYCHEGVW